ncbi:MAG TPA: hypothetical protein PK544_16715 [Spirochaetota bacterium]|nr:hypothetical protein [Spirochaetota bacterium]HPJ39339.1 hypothetical protein [Spirochaetota bacterium]HPQ54143.1 hypothetical protein [Spirochaetota bacterium]
MQYKRSVHHTYPRFLSISLAICLSPLVSSPKVWTEPHNEYAFNPGGRYRHRASGVRIVAPDKKEIANWFCRGVYSFYPCQDREATVRAVRKIADRFSCSF